MKIVWYPHFGVWIYAGRYYFRLVFRVRDFYRRFYFGRDIHRIQ